jgi:hypothetical protein
LIAPHANTFKDIVEISVRANEAQSKTAFASPYTAQVPPEPRATWNRIHQGFYLRRKDSTWLPVFAKNGIDGIRMAMSHQDVRQGFGFSAPSVVRFGGQDTTYPSAIVFDAGFGEILAQPRYENLTFVRSVAGQPVVSSV